MTMAWELRASCRSLGLVNLRHQIAMDGTTLRIQRAVPMVRARDSESLGRLSFGLLLKPSENQAVVSACLAIPISAYNIHIHIYDYMYIHTLIHCSVYGIAPYGVHPRFRTLRTSLEANQAPLLGPRSCLRGHSWVAATAAQILSSNLQYLLICLSFYTYTYLCMSPYTYTDVDIDMCKYFNV